MFGREMGGEEGIARAGRPATGNGGRTGLQKAAPGAAVGGGQGAVGHEDARHAPREQRLGGGERGGKVRAADRGGLGAVEMQHCARMRQKRGQPRGLGRARRREAQIRAGEEPGGGKPAQDRRGQVAVDHRRAGEGQGLRGEASIAQRFQHRLARLLERAGIGHGAHQRPFGLEREIEIGGAPAMQEAHVEPERHARPHQPLALGIRADRGKKRHSEPLARQRLRDVEGHAPGIRETRPGRSAPAGIGSAVWPIRSHWTAPMQRIAGTLMQV